MAGTRAKLELTNETRVLDLACGRGRISIPLARHGCRVTGTPVRVAFVSHYSHLRMGGQRSMALLIEHLDRRVVTPLAICPEPGELANHLARLDCPVMHVPLQPIKPRTSSYGRTCRGVLDEG